MKAESRTVREATLDVLRLFGVNRVFGNPGSTELPFLHDWPADIDYVLGLQESCVVGMADGYAQATGRPAFVNLHSAAGLGHALGSLFTAFRNKSPLVITAGQQARSLLRMRPYLFAEDAAQFPKPYVKWSVEPARAEDVPAAIMQAFLTATQRPWGPTFVSVPSDDWSRPAPRVVPRAIAADVAPDGDAIARLASAIATARRPAFVVGPEVDRSGAVAAMVTLAERAGAEVWASPMSSRCSFPEHHPHFAGFLPAMPAGLDQALRDADLIVVFGAPVFTFHVEGPCGLLAGEIQLWQVTDDPVEAASAAVGTTIIGAVSKAVAALLEAAPVGRDLPLASERRPAAVPAAAMPIPVAYALSRIAALLPEDAIVVEEAPSHRPAIQRHLPRPGADSFYTMASGGLGHGVPAAVGIALARPGRRIACVVGDGSAMYAIQAIWTAAQRRLPITFLVLNNAGYGAMRSFSRLLQAERPPGIELPGIDFVSMVRGLGCPAVRVTAPDGLDRELEAALAGEGPALVDVALDAGAADLFDV